MPVTFCLIAAGLWITTAVKNPALAAGLAGIWTIYLTVRLKKKPAAIILFLLLSACTIPRLDTAIIRPEPGEFRISTVKSSYVIAENETGKLIVNDTDAAFGDTILIETVEEVSSLENLHLFSFAQYLNDQGIGYRGSGEVTDRSTSLKARIFHRLKNSPIALQTYYGITDSETDNWLTSMGLPAVSFFLLLENMLRKRTKNSGLVTVFLASLYGLLFVWTDSLFRMVLFRLVRTRTEDRLMAWGLSVILFLLILPERAASFSFVLPALLQFASLVTEPARQKRVSLVLLSILQILYFQSWSPLTLFGYGILRKGAALIFVLTWVCPGILEPVLNIPLWDGIPAYENGMAILLLSIGAVLLVWEKRGSIPILILGAVFAFYGPWLDPFFHVYVLDLGR